jgi:hypothetical protein
VDEPTRVRQIAQRFGRRARVGPERTGVGIALLPAPNCGRELEAGSLVRVLPGREVAGGILHLVFPSRRGMLPSVRAVIDFLAEALRSHAEGDTMPASTAGER